MSVSRFYQNVTPNPLDTYEQAERFAHRDLNSPDLDPARVWAEAELIQHRLASLIFQKERGAMLSIVDGHHVYEDEWFRDRLQRLRTILRGRAA